MKKIAFLTLITTLSFACGDDDNQNNSNTSGQSSNNGTTNNGSSGSNNGTTTASNNGTTVSDLCATINCGNPAPTCEENTLVSYKGEGGCDPLSGCFRGDEVRVDCELDKKVCQDSACIDLCSDITCEAPQAFCTDNLATSYSADGLCNFLDGMCDFESVEMTIDCTMNNEVCRDGACYSLTPVIPGPGDLVITEILPHPTSRNFSAQWFEIKNLTNAPLILNDITITDYGNQTHVIRPGNDILVEPGDYFVVGGSMDMTVNGGIVMDYTWENADELSLSRTDEIVLENPANVVIDQVKYDDTNGYSAGGSTQIGNQHDLAIVDNDDNALWCRGRSIFGTDDYYGTPGSANEDCLPPALLTIYDIQDTSRPNHPAVDTIVELKGVVVTAVEDRYVWIQEMAGGEYSGIHVRANNNLAANLQVGDTVDLIGQYQESGVSSSTIFATLFTVVSTPGVAPEPEILEERIFWAGGDAEKWEGVLVQIKEAGISNNDTQGGLVGSAKLGKLLFDHATPSTCTFFDSLTGPLDHRYGTYRIQPRSDADMVLSTKTVVDQRSNTEGSIDILNTVDAYSPEVLCIGRLKPLVYTNLDPLLSHDIIRRDPTKVDPNNITTQSFVPLLAPGETHRSTTGHILGTRHYRSTMYPAMEGVIIFTP